jgi:hypothetical protein
MQKKPRKSKENRLEFLCFPLPNRDFSKDYERKNKKMITSQLALQVAQRASSRDPSDRAVLILTRHSAPTPKAVSSTMLIVGDRHAAV